MENVSNMLISKIVVTEDSNLTNAHQVHGLEEIHFETKRMEWNVKMLWYYLRDFSLDIGEFFLSLLIILNVKCYKILIKIL